MSAFTVTNEHIAVLLTAGLTIEHKPLRWEIPAPADGRLPIEANNPDEVALGWTVFGTVAATPFIAETDRDTLQAIADRDIASDTDDLAETDDNSDNGPTTHREERP